MEVQEYYIAQLYAVAIESLDNTGNGEGVTVVKNEPFEDQDSKGQYTYKVYDIESKVPSFIKMVAPKGSLQFNEHAWNRFPHCVTKYSNEYFSNSFSMVITSEHLPDNGMSENVFSYTPDQLKKRKIIHINIADSSKVDPSKYSVETDPTMKKSESCNVLPLRMDFATHAKPIMCCYKYYMIDVNVFGGSVVEKKIITSLENFLFEFHRKLICLIDQWKGMTIEELRAFEDQTTKKLKEKFAIQHAT